jgi:predicted PurR-regulated permease PerM
MASDRRQLADGIQPVPAPDASTTVVTMGAVVLALYFGRDLLIPLALAVLVSFGLAPLVAIFRRLRLGRIASVLLAVVIATVALGSIGALLTSQLVTLAERIPVYELNLRTKVAGLHDILPSGGVVDRTTAAIKDLNREIEQATQGEKPPPASQLPGSPPTQKPVPVELHQPAPTPIQMLTDVVGPLLGPLGTAGLTLILVIFMLVERSELRDRLIRLLGDRDIMRSTRTMDEGAHRISRYLLMQLGINVLYGTPFGLGLWAIGVPNPLLWGMLAALLRFIPYLGPLVGAAGPLALALAVDPGWTMVGLTLALILVLELVTANVLEPWLYGSITGLSPLAILAAAVFWTTLWGPIGLLLSVPLTVCVVVLGRHVPRLQFLDMLLGDRPALTTPARLYQRLLADDHHEAMELAEDYHEEEGFEPLIDEVLLPTLALAERDRQRAVLDPVATQRLAEAVESIADDLVADHGDEADDDEDTPTAGLPQPAQVLCMGGRSRIDLAAARLLAVRMAAQHIEATVAADTVIGRLPKSLAAAGRPSIACIVYLGRPSGHQARRTVRRLRSALGKQGQVLLGFWFDPDEKMDTAEPIGDDGTVRTIAEMVHEVTLQLERQGADAAPSSEPTPTAAAEVASDPAASLSEARPPGFSPAP